MAAPVLELRNIVKSYEGNRVLKGVSLAVRPGTIHALVGENGAGKSTLMNVLFGMSVIHARARPRPISTERSAPRRRFSRIRYQACGTRGWQRQATCGRV